MSMCNCFTCDCKCSKCVLLLLWHVYVCVTCSFVSVCVSLMRPKGLSGHVRLCMHSFFLCTNVLECVYALYKWVDMWIHMDMDPQGTLSGTSCLMVSEGLLFH